jgi:hypothetical protein
MTTLHTNRRTWLFMALLLGSALRVVAAPAAPTAADPYRDAFLAFFPAYEMARLRYTAIEDTANPRRGQLNGLNHLRRLLDHTARNVTAPNNDTLYSSARLDLRLGPLLVETPAIPQRYYSLQFMNFYTDNLAILGRRVGGDGPLKIAVVGPGWTGPVPAHTHLVQADTNDLWLLVRTLIDGADDIPAVAALQDGMHITAPKPAADYPAQRLRPPKDPDPAAFIAVVNEVLQRNPPQGAMAAKAAAAAPLGIGGKRTWADLPEDVRNGWTTRWAALNTELQNPANMRHHLLRGWEYPPDDIGQWSQNDLLRATIALRGIAALDPDETLYLSTFVDIDGQPLSGQQRYRLRVPPGGVPVKGFWSLTMYEVLPDGRFFFTDNPIGRYSIGNRTRGLKVNADGSTDLLLQADAPARAEDAANWLPAPRGPFRLTLRAYLPDPALVRGEAPLPRIERQ